MIEEGRRIPEKWSATNSIYQESIVNIDKFKTRDSNIEATDLITCGG